MALAVAAAGCAEVAQPHRHVGEFLADPGPPAGVVRIEPESTVAPAPVPTPESTPSLAPEPAPAPTLPPLTDTQASFLGGYRVGGGDPAWEEHWVNDVIPCESEWVLDPPGYHYGLAQFAPGTWGQARCSSEANYRDPWEQGCAVAKWMQQIPGRWGTTSGWPACWWR